MTTIADNVNQWLRDAHAAEGQAETILESSCKRLDNYPELKRRLEQHVEETRHQRDQIEQCLERRGASTSAIKNVGAQLSAMMQGVSGAMASDEVVKTVLFTYAFEHMEIASYRILVAAAETEGDTQTRQVCEQILQEEIAMADWLHQAMPEVTRTFLMRDEQGADAKR